MLLALPSDISALAHAYIVESIDPQQSQLALLETAQMLLCQQQQQTLSPACGQCHSCHLFAANNHPDLLVSAAEQTSIGIDQVRQVSEFLTKTAQLSGNQVVLIEQAQKMTENASNALLKTLEEPTQNSYILLSCQQKDQLLPTILSRCQFLSIEKKDKASLQQDYPQLPDYLIGFSQGAESKLQAWLEDASLLEQFEHLYQCFIKWLKGQIPDFVLLDALAKEPELMAFLLYLLSRRVYQLALKQAPNAWQAQDLVNHFQQQTSTNPTLNKHLALADLLTGLKPLI